MSFFVRPVLFSDLYSVDSRLKRTVDMTKTKSHDKRAVIAGVFNRGDSRHFFGVFSDLGEILGRKAKKRRSVV